MRELLLKLHSSVQGQEGDVYELVQNAGGVSDEVIEAIRAIVTDETLDGEFVSMAINPPGTLELIQHVENADPVLLYKVR